MSGIYIPGIEMPTSCSECKIRTVVGCCGNLPHNTRMPGCPIIPVPDHGRLGDLDELEKTFREDADADWNRFAAPINWADAFDDVADIVADAPTIIPADKEAEE